MAVSKKGKDTVDNLNKYGEHGGNSYGVVFSIKMSGVQGEGENPEGVAVRG
jgi:hypothetical protein